jgi:hypothetical protein
MCYRSGWSTSSTGRKVWVPGPVGGYFTRGIEKGSGSLDSKDVEHLLREGQEALDRSKALQEAWERSATVPPRADPSSEPASGPHAQTPNSPSKPVSSVRTLSKAPPPITPLRGASWRPIAPKPIQVPKSLPSSLPDFMAPQADAIICDAAVAFADQTQISEFCRQVVANLSPHFCAAVKDKRLQPSLVRVIVSDLLRYLLVPNCNYEREGDHLEGECWNSDEWRGLAREIARVSSEAEPSTVIAPQRAAVKPRPRPPGPALEVAGIHSPPPRARLLQRPRPEWPALFPVELRLTASRVITEGLGRFQDNGKILEFCKHVVSGLAPRAYEIVEGKLVEGHFAQASVQNLLSAWIRENCFSAEAMNRVENEALKSDEWRALTVRLEAIGLRSHGSDDYRELSPQPLPRGFWLDAFEAELGPEPEPLKLAGCSPELEDKIWKRVDQEWATAEIARALRSKAHTRVQSAGSLTQDLQKMKEDVELYYDVYCKVWTGSNEIISPCFLGALYRKRLLPEIESGIFRIKAMLRNRIEGVNSEDRALSRLVHLATDAKWLRHEWRDRIQIKAKELEGGKQRRIRLKHRSDEPSGATNKMAFEKGKRCERLVREVKIIKHAYVNQARKMTEIQEQSPSLLAWEIRDSLNEEDREMFQHPNQWGPVVGYAERLLEKTEHRSRATIQRWRKHYKRTLRTRPK